MSAIKHHAADHDAMVHEHNQFTDTVGDAVIRIQDEAYQLGYARAKQEAGQPAEPFWYAIVSESAPVINSTRKRADLAEELAGKLREIWPDVEVIPLYRGATSRT
jgi:hypothetical protein